MGGSGLRLNVIDREDTIHYGLGEATGTDLELEIRVEDRREVLIGSIVVLRSGPPDR